MSISRRHQRLRIMVGGRDQQAWAERKAMLRSLMHGEHGAAFQVFAAVVKISRDEDEVKALMQDHGVDLTQEKRFMARPTTIPGSLFRKGPFFSRSYGWKAQVPEYQALYTKLPYVVREGEHIKQSNAAQDAQAIIDRYLPGVKSALPHLDFDHENKARTDDLEIHFQFAVRPVSEIDHATTPQGVLQPMRLPGGTLVKPLGDPARVLKSDVPKADSVRLGM